MDDVFEFEIENGGAPSEDKVFVTLPMLGSVRVVIPDDEEVIADAKND